MYPLWQSAKGRRWLVGDRRKETTFVVSLFWENGGVAEGYRVTASALQQLVTVLAIHAGWWIVRKILGPLRRVIMNDQVLWLALTVIAVTFNYVALFHCGNRVKGTNRLLTTPS